ncbi:MAG: LuxR C-terminal-related transcriptional regulator [Burkholderiales bacterium]
MLPELPHDRSGPLLPMIDDHVLDTRLAPPPARAGQVRRPQLVERICAADGLRLVLVRAPAGFGKTTLMGQCWAHLRQRGGAALWVGLTTTENDPAGFLACVAAALATLTADGSAASLRSARSGDLGDAAQRVLGLLNRAGPDCMLFLDEFELIHDPMVLGLVRELIDQLPATCRIVLGTRQVPALPLSRLRAQGQLLEIDATMLRFSLSEATALLGAHPQLALAADELALLHRRTEGWAAALWLAALALEGQRDGRGFIERFSGSHDTIADYLTESVLAHQPAEVQRFLLRTSVLHQLTPALCQALVPEVDAERQLRELARADILISPVEGLGSGYRYHSLFSDFLRAQLQREMPEEAPRLHRRASAWFAQALQPVPAIDHAIAGNDFAAALAMLDLHAPELLSQGRMRLLDRWFSALPGECMTQHPRLQAIQLWAMAYTQDAERASQWLSRSGLEHTDDAELRSYILPLRPLLLAMRDCIEEALDVGLACLARLPTTSTFADAALTSMVAAMHAGLGQFGPARQLLERARAIEPSGFVVMYAESIEGEIDAQEGRLRQARARLKLAIAASRGSRVSSNGSAWGSTLLAWTLYEANDLSAAASLMRTCVPLLGDRGPPDLMVLLHSGLARIAFQNGDVDRAFEALTELEYLGRKRHSDRVVCAAKLERGRILLLQGHVKAARDELDRAEAVVVGPTGAGRRALASELEDLVIGQLRWDALAGDAAAAADEAAGLALQAASASRHLRAMKLRLLQALALARAQRPAQAQAVLAPLLSAACDEGFVRLVVDEGPAAAQLVSDAAHSAPAAGRSDPIFLEYLQRLLEACGLPVGGTAPPAEPVPTGPVEPFTARAIAVLRLVADGYADTAIADKLSVSTSAVRSHLRNIYARLGVHSRMQAVVAARRAGLL